MKKLLLLGIASMVLSATTIQAQPTQIKPQVSREYKGNQVIYVLTDEFTWNMVFAYPKFKKAIVKQVEGETEDRFGRYKSMTLYFKKDRKFEKELEAYIMKVRKNHI